MRTGRMVSGPLLVAQACYRRLSTPRGLLVFWLDPDEIPNEDDANYGFDLLTEIGTAVTDNATAALPGRISSELLKDERLSDVTVNIVATKSGPTVSYNIDIRGDTASGPFSLVLSVSEVSVSILAISG